MHWRTVHAAQSNSCSALDFLSPEPWPQQPWRLNALITWFRESCSIVSMSHESKRLKNQTAGWTQAMHWYSIWVKMHFSCFSVVPGSAEAQVIWGGIVICLLIAYSISSISAKKYQNPFPCLKVTAIQKWDIFFRRGVGSEFWHILPCSASTARDRKRSSITLNKSSTRLSNEPSTKVLRCP